MTDTIGRLEVNFDGEYEPSPEKWVRDQVEAYEASGGTEGNTFRNRPVVIVTSIGARSGKVRKNPVMRVERDGRYALVASLGGAPTNPTWYYNLLKYPHIKLQDGPVPRFMDVRLLEGAERAEWWDRAVEAHHNYRDMQSKTDREIPIFLAEPTN